MDIGNILCIEYNMYYFDYNKMKLYSIFLKNRNRKIVFLKKKKNNKILINYQ